MTRRRLFSLRYYRRPGKRAALYARCFGRVASFRRNLHARRQGGFRTWFAALFASLFARQLAHRYAVRPDMASKGAPVLRRRQKRPRRGMPTRGGLVRRYAGAGKDGETLYRTERGPDGMRYETWRTKWRARQAERYGLATIEKHGRAVAWLDDPDARRAMRNARKAERRLQREARS